MFQANKLPQRVNTWAFGFRLRKDLARNIRFPTHLFRKYLHQHFSFKVFHLSCLLRLLILYGVFTSMDQRFQSIRLTKMDDNEDPSDVKHKAIKWQMRREPATTGWHVTSNTWPYNFWNTAAADITYVLVERFESAECFPKVLNSMSM